VSYQEFLDIKIYNKNNKGFEKQAVIKLLVY